MTVFGQGDYKYELVEGWAKVPSGFKYRPEGVRGKYLMSISGDSQGNIYVSGQNIAHPLMVLDSNGNFIDCWGEGHIIQPHGIHVGPDDSLYVTDRAAQVIEKYTPSGELLKTWGRRFSPVPIFVRRPFNLPSSMTIAPNGEMYVADGYGNSLVHRFSPEPESKLLNTWGDYGTGPGQFVIAHSVAVDSKGLVYVADRVNERIQKFTAEGELITIWDNVNFPMDLKIDARDDTVYTLECLDYRGWPDKTPNVPRITVRDTEGNILSELLGNRDEGRGVLDIGHGFWISPQGDIYEVDSIADSRIQKFARI